MAKTVQALKIMASWTPNAESAGAMMVAALNGTDAHRMRFNGGRLNLRHAIKIDFADPAQAARVSERVAQIKAALALTGEVHTFTTTAGAVHAVDAEVLDAPAAQPEPDAVDPAELPAGWRIREDDGALILPDMIGRRATSLSLAGERGHSAILARFARIETEGGAVLKSREATDAEAAA